MKQRALQKLVIMIAAFVAVSGAVWADEVKSSFLYTLSDFKGIVPVSWPKIKVDGAKDEIYVITSTSIKVFNENGMEIHSFNEGMELGSIPDLAVDPSGDILVLSGTESRPKIIRCNFRGEPVSTLELGELPAEYAGFSPYRIDVRGNSIYLASPDMKVVVLDEKGGFRKGYDLAALPASEVTEKEKADLSFTGYSVDREGNILFTSSALARVFRLSTDGKIESFGVRGSTAGRFGVPGGVVADASGRYLLVADTLRCVVMVFSREFRFHAEFGYRGNKPGNLVGPLYMAVDNNNKIYVSQLGNRGVNVYQMSTS